MTSGLHLGCPQVQAVITSLRGKQRNALFNDAHNTILKLLLNGVELMEWMNV